MKINKNWGEQKWVPYTIATCSAVLLFFALNHIGLVLAFVGGVWKVLRPVLLALVLAYLIDPIARFYHKKVFRKARKQAVMRKVSITLAVLTVILVIGLLCFAIIPQFIESSAGVITIVQDSLKHSDRLLAKWTANLPEQMQETIEAVFVDFDVFKILSGLDIKSFFESGSFKTLASTSVSVGSAIGNFIIAFILAIYFLMDKDHLVSLFQRTIGFLTKPKTYNWFMDFWSRCDRILLRYISCSLLEAVIVGFANSIFMMICRLPYVMLISVVVGLTNLAPTFGPIVGALIGAFLLILVNPWYALWFLIFTIVLQTLDGYIIKPKLFGDTLGVSALLILITIVVGGQLFGVLGIIFAIPFAAIAEYMVKEWVSIAIRRKAEREYAEREAAGRAAAAASVATTEAAVAAASAEAQQAETERTEPETQTAETEQQA